MRNILFLSFFMACPFVWSCASSTTSGTRQSIYFFEDGEQKKEQESLSQQDELLAQVAKKILYEPCPCCEQRLQEKRQNIPRSSNPIDPMDKREILARIKGMENRLAIVRMQLREIQILQRSSIPRPNREEFKQGIVNLEQEVKWLERQIKHLREHLPEGES